MAGVRSPAQDRQPPAVIVVCPPGRGHDQRLREVLAGLEEEGVPFRVERSRDADAEAPGWEAAQASKLGVGVELRSNGFISVHHAKFPASTPMMTGSPEQARSLGHNAARLVVGVAFKACSGSGDDTT